MHYLGSCDEGSSEFELRMQLKCGIRRHVLEKHYFVFLSQVRRQQFTEINIPAFLGSGQGRCESHDLPSGLEVIRSGTTKGSLGKKL